MNNQKSKSKPADSEQRCGKGLSVQSLVGRIGEFTAANGAVLQCVITGYDPDPPFDDECLIIDYIHEDGSKVKGAMIPVALFRDDSSPNAGAVAPPPQRPASGKDVPGG